MAFELLMVLTLIVVFLISFCGFLRKLRNQVENECSTNGTGNSVETGCTNEGLEVEESGGVFPASLAPPPYSEYDLPPKYDEVVKHSKDIPQVHMDYRLTHVTTHY